MQQLGDLSLAGTAEHILLVGRNGILDVDIYNVRAESIPAFGGILAALYKVCKVECGLEVCAVQRLHQVNTAGKNITIDILLVFVHQDHVVLFSNGNELAQLLDDSVTIVGRILAFRHKEAEHADVLAIQDLSDLAQRFQLSTLLFKALFIIDLDLANGTAQAGNANTSGLQAGQQIGLDFLNGKVSDSLFICTAQADVLHSKLTDCLELLIKRRADLVGKARNINILHKNLLFCVGYKPYYN